MPARALGLHTDQEKQKRENAPRRLRRHVAPGRKWEPIRYVAGGNKLNSDSRTAVEFDPPITHYCTAFLDVLGQRDRLRKLRALPSDEKQIAEMAPVVVETIGFIHEFRDGFATFYRNFGNTEHPDLELTEEQRKALSPLREQRLYTNGFGDAFVASVELASEKDWLVTMNSILAVVLSACSMFPIALGRGHPIRGGIDVGIGGLVSEAEVYGANLIHAYDLESKHARYPRVLIGDELLTFLNWLGNQDLKSMEGMHAKQLASMLGGFFYMDFDGMVALDYLGAEMREKFPAGAVNELLTAAAKMAASSYSDARRQGNLQLASKYGYLLTYMEGRLPAWGVSIDTNPAT